MGWEDCYFDLIDSVNNTATGVVEPAAGGVVIEFIVFFYCFVGLAIVCDDHLVVSLETLVQKLQVPEDVAGASFMAFGSAAPEIIINAVSTIKATAGSGSAAQSATDLGIGAILGRSVAPRWSPPCPTRGCRFRRNVVLAFQLTGRHRLRPD